MRQLCGFLALIDKSSVTRFYENTLSYASVQGVKMPSLEEFLGLGSEDQGNGSAFDEKTDAFLEQRALQKLEEAKAKHGRQ